MSDWTAVRAALWALCAGGSCSSAVAVDVVHLDESCVSTLVAECVVTMSDPAKISDKRWQCVLGMPPLEGKSDTEKEAARKQAWSDCEIHYSTPYPAKPEEVVAQVNRWRLVRLKDAAGFFKEHGPVCQAFAQAAAHRSCKRTISVSTSAELNAVNASVLKVEAGLEKTNKQLQQNFINALVCAFTTVPADKEKACKGLP